MAKIKSAGLRNYVGKLGGNVYYMNKGQNIGRELAPEVSNPRTPAQMRQRLKWANIVNVYKANKDWMGHLSFENKPEHWSYYNAFMSANIGSAPVYLTKQMAEHGNGVLAPYLMTDGTLPSISYEGSASGEFYTTLRCESFDDNLSIGGLSTAILNVNPDWREGDQLSIVLMYRMGVRGFVVCPIEVVIDKSDTTSLSDITTEFSDLESYLATDDGFLTIHAESGVSTFSIALCVVHSRTENGKTFVSRQSFGLSYDAMYDYNQAGTDEAFNYAYASYGYGDEFFLATPGAAIGGGVGPAVVQNISRVAYGRSFFSSYAEIDFTTPDSGFPARIDIYMESYVEGEVTLSVGGVSLTPSVVGSLISTWITSTQASTIDGATAANKKIRVTIAGTAYEWT